MKSVLVQRAQTSTTLSSSNTTISNWPITNGLISKTGPQNYSLYPFASSSQTNFFLKKEPYISNTCRITFAFEGDLAMVSHIIILTHIQSTVKCRYCKHSQAQKLATHKHATHKRNQKVSPITVALRHRLSEAHILTHLPHQRATDKPFITTYTPYYYPVGISVNQAYNFPTAHRRPALHHGHQ